MFHNTVLTPLSYFYALGNTPAVSLTQDLLPEQDADILCLGSGDARNLFFTCYASNAKLDVTCCDIEPGVHARNALLYTLLIDGVAESKFIQIWNIYFHWKIDEASRVLLGHQAEKLLSLSSSTEAWRQSEYGPVIKFCDARSLDRVRSYWKEFPISKDKSYQDERERELAAAFNKAKMLRREYKADGVSLTGLRSAAPLGYSALQDFQEVAKQWWEEGFTTGQAATVKATYHNPAFAPPTNPSLVLHYGIEPLAGFPLATSYCPLLKTEPFHVNSTGSSSTKLVESAREQFRIWALAFKRSTSAGSVVRLFVGDALTFCSALHSTNEGRPNFFCENVTNAAISLDPTEYLAPGRSAPTVFDVIDSSNLVDHLGSLNILLLTERLLRPQPTSCLYTEALVQNSRNVAGRLRSLLGIDPRILALLFGLLPVEMYTGATTSHQDESLMEQFQKGEEKDGNPNQPTQIRSRLRWKVTAGFQSDGRTSLINADASEVLRLIIALYEHMFQNEDPSNLMESLTLGKFSSSLSSAHYNKCSFAALVDYLRCKVNANWAEVISTFYNWLEQRESAASSAYAQELYLYMHLLDLDTDKFTIWKDGAPREPSLAIFESWKSMPDQICVTIKVPRARLQVFTKRKLHAIGIPVVSFSITGSNAATGQWSNSFSVTQICFGEANVRIDGGETILHVEEDSLSWSGTSDMFVSALVPAFILLQDGLSAPSIHCNLMPTSQVFASYAQDLGKDLRIFSTNIISGDAFVTRYMPGLPGLPTLKTNNTETNQSKDTLSIKMSNNAVQVETLTQRLNIIDKDVISKFADRSSAVKVEFESPLDIRIKIANSITLAMRFPAPIATSKKKIRIARKSSYIEIEAPLLDPLQDEPSFLLPTTLISMGKSKVPMLWNASNIDLDKLPTMDTSVAKKLDWLKLHSAHTFSSREKDLRESSVRTGMSLESKKTHIGLRTEVKDSVYRMMLTCAGLLGERHKAFALNLEGVGAQIAIIPSCVRLDLVNHTAVLDTAVVVLTEAMWDQPQVGNALHDFGAVLGINVNEGELRCWKSLLLAMVERCRSWQHSAGCEYVRNCQVPLPGAYDVGNPLICSCGIGKFPSRYLKDLRAKSSNIDYLLKHCATRMALSIIFPVPYVEECFVEAISKEFHTQN